MGLFDFVDDVVDTVSDVAEKVEKGAEWVAETAEQLGLGPVARVAKTVGKFAGKLAIAPTPVLEGGQKVIEKMIDSAGGDNEPEHGEAFGNGSRAFEAQLQTLRTAHPGQLWEGGTASKAYAERTHEQENRVATLSEADIEIAQILTGEADQLRLLRKVLVHQHQFLADFGSYTQYLSTLGPEGKAAQYTLETWAVSMAMMECIPRMWDMHNNANDNAARVREAIDMYKDVASKVVISDSNNDFDPPKR
ncbi:EspA/EspE family type VII secretion system effector [Mycobacterium sp. MMS18-G62]